MCKQVKSTAKLYGYSRQFLNWFHWFIDRSWFLHFNRTINVTCFFLKCSGVKVATEHLMIDVMWFFYLQWDPWGFAVSSRQWQHRISDVSDQDRGEPSRQQQSDQVTLLYSAQPSSIAGLWLSFTRMQKMPLLCPTAVKSNQCLSRSSRLFSESC